MLGLCRLQKSKGVCKDQEEAEKEIALRLEIMRIDRGIAEGEADFEAGRYEEATPKIHKDCLTE